MNRVFTSRFVHTPRTIPPSPCRESTDASALSLRQRTQSLHPSRPSAFGPHLLEKPLRGFLYPISLYTSSSYGCSLPSNSVVGPPRDGDEEWIALVQRGECPFSNKVRIAQDLGAKAVIFGDETEERGGIKGGKGLLTPWSPGESSLPSRGSHRNKTDNSPPSNR